MDIQRGPLLRGSSPGDSRVLGQSIGGRVKLDLNGSKLSNQTKETEKGGKVAFPGEGMRAWDQKRHRLEAGQVEFTRFLAFSTFKNQPV